MSDFTDEEIEAAACLEQELDIWRPGDRALVIRGEYKGREAFVVFVSGTSVVRVVYTDSSLGTWFYTSNLVRLPPNPKET